MCIRDSRIAAEVRQPVGKIQNGAVGDDDALRRAGRAGGEEQVHGIQINDLLAPGLQKRLVRRGLLRLLQTHERRAVRKPVSYTHLRGHHFAVRHVLGQMVVHEDRHLRADLVGRKRRRGQDVQEIILRRVGSYIRSEIVRDPEICAACHAGADHLADVVAEVRAVVEIAHLAADAAGRKIPERRDPVSYTHLLPRALPPRAITILLAIL